MPYNVTISCGVRMDAERNLIARKMLGFGFTRPKEGRSNLISGGGTGIGLAVGDRCLPMDLQTNSTERYNHMIPFRD